MLLAMSNRPRAEFPAETGRRGEFVRQSSAFRERVTADGSSGFKAEPGRYHLYVSLACPWAHRTIIFRKLKALEAVIGMTVVDPIRDERGWAFTRCARLRSRSDQRLPLSRRGLPRHRSAAFDGRVTVPVLWDKQAGKDRQQRIGRDHPDAQLGVRRLGTTPISTSIPKRLRDEIDAVNDEVYANDQQRRLPLRLRHQPGGLRRGVRETVRRPGQAGRAAVAPSLPRRRPDYRGRLAAVHDARPLRPRLSRPLQVQPAPPRSTTPTSGAYTRDLYQVPGVAETVNLDHIKRHYYVTHRAINPTGVVPRGPEIDFGEPHGRA